jgi:hypothetical protein
MVILGVLNKILHWKHSKDWEYGSNDWCLPREQKALSSNPHFVKKEKKIL